MRFRSTRNNFLCGSRSNYNRRCKCKSIKSSRLNNNTKPLRKCGLLNSTLRSKTWKSSTKCKCSTNSSSNRSTSIKLTKVLTYQLNHSFLAPLFLISSKMQSDMKNNTHNNSTVAWPFHLKCTTINECIWILTMKITRTIWTSSKWNLTFHNQAGLSSTTMICLKGLIKTKSFSEQLLTFSNNFLVN